MIVGLRRRQLNHLISELLFPPGSGLSRLTGSVDTFLGRFLGRCFFGLDPPVFCYPDTSHFPLFLCSFCLPSSSPSGERLSVPSGRLLSVFLAVEAIQCLSQSRFILV